VKRTRVTEAIWRALIFGFVGAIVAYPFVLLFADRMPYIAIDAGAMLGCALVASMFCYGIIRVVALLAAAIAAGQLIGWATRPLHLPDWAWTVVWPVVTVLGIRLQRRLPPPRRATPV
jgi:ABC-type uncharacterized transport system permease subunit